MKTSVSVIIEGNKDNRLILPLNIIDLDNHLSKLGHNYEIIIISEDIQSISVAKKISKLLKNASVKVQGKAPSHESLKGDLIIMVRSSFVPEFQSFKNILESLMSEKGINGYELVFGSLRDNSAGNKVLRSVSKLFRSPIDLSMSRYMLGFSKTIAPSVFSAHRKDTSLFDLELALLAERLGYSTGELPLRYKSGEEPSLKSNGLNLAWELLKMKLLRISSAVKVAQSE